MLSGALAKILVSISQPNASFDAPPPEPKYTDLAGVHLRDMVFGLQEPIWVENIRVRVNPRVVKHCPESILVMKQYMTLLWTHTRD